MFETRPLAPAEFERLCADMPLRSHAQHWSNLNRQQAGDLLYLIAWEGARAIGQVTLFWRPANDPAVTLAGCPWVIDLLVHPEHRSRGAGSALLAACEDAARAREHSRIGLGVAVSNLRARALYERLGYRNAGWGDQVMTGSWQDASGQTHIWEDTVTYLIKPLAKLS
jgi:GNAT superfamily N-acetyltransferase